MYLAPEGIKKVVGQLHRALATDGWLIVSPTETSQELFSAFATVSFGDVTFYRKSATGLPKPLARPVTAESSARVQLPVQISVVAVSLIITFPELRVAGSESPAWLRD